MRFVHAADMHLDSPLIGLQQYEGAPAKEIRGATRQALCGLVKLALDEQVDFVLIAGDLYDGDWRDYNTGLFFVSQMSRLCEAGIRVFLVTGNHDAANQITKALSLPENVTMFKHRRPETVTLDDLGVAIHGQSFGARAVTDDLSAAYSDPHPGVFNIGLLHTNVDGRKGHDNYAPSSLDGLRSKGYNYWALGHIHTSEVLSKEPWIVYPGNIQGRYVRETGVKGCILVEVEDGEVTSCEHHALDVVRWAICRVDAGDSADANDVMDLVNDALADEMNRAGDRLLAVRVEVEGVCRAHEELSRNPEQWTNEVRARALDMSDRIWIEQVRFITRAELDLGELAERDDALGWLLRGMRDLDADETNLDKLIAVFHDLDQKLPHEVKSGDEALRLDDSATIRAMLNEVRDLIISRILSRGGAS